MENNFFNEYPYTDFHELNLSWVIRELRSFATTLEQFVSINALKYADPIQWNITTQYEKNTIVIDPQTGTAYISVQPVPAGVALTNEDYWTVVFNLRSFVVRAAQNFTLRYEEDTTLTATFNSSAGDWLVWGDTLYIANVNITAGDSYVVGGNIRRITVEEEKDIIVGMISDNYNEIISKIGDLENLTTTDKTNVVSAINSLLTAVQNADATLQGNIDAEALARQNADNTLQGNIDAEALARQNADGDLSNLNTTDKSNLVAAINEVNNTGGGASAKIGNLEDLDTTDKSTVVAAINETLGDVEKINHVLGVIIGDSYATHDPLTPGTPNWAKNMGELLVEYGFLDEQYSFSQDGTRYSAGSQNNFYIQITTAGNDSRFNNADVNYVIIEGGQNERFEANHESTTFYNTLYARVIETVAHAKATFPNAKVVVMPMAWNGKQLKVYPYKNIFNAIYDAATVAGAIVDRSSIYYGYSTKIDWESDGGHPTYAGLQALTHKIGTILDGGFVGANQNYIVLLNNQINIAIESATFFNGKVSFTLSGKATAQIAAGSILSYTYPGFSRGSTGTGYYVSGGTTVNMLPKITVDSSYTGTINAPVAIPANADFIVHFEYDM